MSLVAHRNQFEQRGAEVYDAWCCVLQHAQKHPLSGEPTHDPAPSWAFLTDAERKAWMRIAEEVDGVVVGEEDERRGGTTS